MEQSFTTLFLIFATIAVSVKAFNDKETFDKLKFNAYMVFQKKEYYRIISHALIHGSWMHLGINMFVLYSFGGMVETLYSHPILFPKTFYYGKFLYVLMYILAAAFASIPALLKHKNNHSYNAVGASGAVSAVAFTTILLYPQGKIQFILFPFIDIPNVIFGVAYLGYSYYMSKNSKDNIAHDAHFAGAVFGLLFPLLLNPSLFSRFINLVF